MRSRDPFVGLLNLFPVLFQKLELDSAPVDLTVDTRNDLNRNNVGHVVACYSDGLDYFMNLCIPSVMVFVYVTLL